MYTEKMVTPFCLHQTFTLHRHSCCHEILAILPSPSLMVGSAPNDISKHTIWRCPCLKTVVTHIKFKTFAYRCHPSSELCRFISIKFISQKQNNKSACHRMCCAASVMRHVLTIAEAFVGVKYWPFLGKKRWNVESVCCVWQLLWKEREGLKHRCHTAIHIAAHWGRGPQRQRQRWRRGDSHRKLRLKTSSTVTPSHLSFTSTQYLDELSHLNENLIVQLEAETPELFILHFRPKNYCRFSGGGDRKGPQRQRHAHAHDSHRPFWLRALRGQKKKKLSEYLVAQCNGVEFKSPPILSTAAPFDT